MGRLASRRVGAAALFPYFDRLLEERERHQVRFSEPSRLPVPGMRTDERDGLPSILSIGVVAGGSRADTERLAKAATRLHKEIQRILPPLTPDDARLNVVFHVPGEILRPDYEGARSGRFERATNSLMVQVAVPESSLGEVDERSTLLSLLSLAVECASEFFATRGIAANLARHDQVIAQLQCAS